MTTQHWLGQVAAGERSRLLLFAAASAAGVCAYRLHSTSALWVPVALGGVAIAVWHGAYDGVLAERAFAPRFSHRWRLPFYLSYVLLAATILVLWQLAPVAALISFLLYSAFHFGTEAEHRRTWLALTGAVATGAIPIAAACRWWPQEVDAIFTTMLRGAGTSAASVQQAGAWLLIPAVLFAAATAFWQRRLLWVRLGLIGVELLLFRFCHPVVAFAIFFCLWHTPEHLVETSRDRPGDFSLSLACSNLRRGIGPWLLSLSALTLALVFGHHAMAAFTGVIFVALSALTVPHMALALLLPTGQHTVADRPGYGACQVAR